MLPASTKPVSWQALFFVDKMKFRDILSPCN